MGHIFKISLICLWVILCMCFRINAQSSQSIGTHPSKDQPSLPEYLPETKDKEFTLPPVPKLEKRSPAGPLFVLNTVVFEGNTVFSDQELSRISTGFLNRQISLADLEELRYQLTRFYVDKGYPNSGALIKPGQTVDDGRIIFTVIEGRLQDIRISGNARLNPNYIANRIWPDSTLPFNTHLLQENFQMLLQDPLIKKMNGRILPGIKSGDALLDLEVTREKPYEVNVVFDNHSPSSLGSNQFLLDSEFRNLTGFGDTLDLILGLTEGSDEMGFSFSVPLSSRNTIISVGYSRSDNTVIEEPLDDIDVTSQLERFFVSLNHPIYHTLRRRVDLGLTLDSQKSETSLLGQPFSFSEGYIDGESRVSTLRLIQLFEDRSFNHALVLRSSVNFGLDLFDATILSDNRTDGEFISWLGQFRYSHRLGDRLGHVVFRGDVQFSDDTLISMEQFAVGGALTVRGYRENELVRDNGYVTSLEWRIPLWQERSPAGNNRSIQFAPFFDYGAGWNKGESSNDHVLYSAGFGLIWSSRKIDAQIYFSHGFEHVASKTEHNLQDDGIHFSVTLKLF